MSYKYMQFQIPERMEESLRAYLEDHRSVGGFLRAVIENDLLRAVTQADNENIANLPAFVGYLWDNAPLECWGTPEKYKTWIKKEDEE
jgi:hypothetical protein